jgi:GGDEF domain-containing protein
MIQGYYFGRPEPAEVYLNMLRHSALPDENYDERGYYNQIGRANPLSPTPLLEMAESNADDVPLAIMELRAGRVSFLSMSQGYRNIIGLVGFHDESHVAEGISERSNSQASRFMDLILAAARTGQEMSMDLVERGSTRLVRVRRIAKGPDDTYAFLLLMAQGLGEQQESSETIDQTLKSLLPAYDRIDLIDLETNTMTNVFHGTASHDMHFPERDPKNRVRIGEFAEFASAHVHPRDAERYLEFADLSTLRARMDARGRSFVTEAFRMRNPDGSYSWKTVFLGLAAISGRDTAIIGMRDVNASVINRVSGDMGITEHDLFQTLISALPFGVFWKDESRRFVGANQFFKDYFGFSDDRSFVGKTDEEMGWHIDPECFMRSEERVLADGAEVNDEHGSCIAGGRRRDIVVTKRRIVHGGETRGLVGYFVDAAARDAISRSFEDLSIVDIHTGLLNGKGLDESAAAYEDIYRRRGVDFALMELAVQGLEAIESTYGRELADRLIARVADTARQTIGVRGICARTFGGSFSLIWQLKRGEDPRNVLEQVKAAVEQITSVDGKRVNPTFSTGAATFSETEDLEGLRSLAQSRMG